MSSAKADTANIYTDSEFQWGNAGRKVTGLVL